MTPQIENIKNPLLRKFAEKAQHKSTGDFGMTIYGGVDLTVYAELIIQECIQQTYPDDFKVDGVVPHNLPDSVSRIKEHFGLPE